MSIKFICYRFYQSVYKYQKSKII